MNTFFITGIDTGCGKTFATGLIARSLKEKGINVITQKLVQTGCKGISEDILEHRRLMGCNLFPEDEEGITYPYVFSTPASPHLAARLDNIDIDINKLTKATQTLARKYDIVLLEGAGGLHVPLTNELLTIEYIKMQNYPVILVSSSKLGSINHTLLSIETCNIHKINLYALIYSYLPESDKIIAGESLRVMRKALQLPFPKTLVEEIYDKDNYETNMFRKIKTQ